MKRILLIFGVALILLSCGNRDVKTAIEPNKTAEPVKDEHQEDNHQEGEESVVSITEEQIKTAGIDFATIELKNLKTSIRASGTLKVPNQNKALITSVNSGILRTLLIQPGSYVRKGQAIGSIINPDAARLQQELQTTNAQINLATTELARQQELVQGNAAPLKNVQRVQTELASLRATRNALSKQLSAMGISPASVSMGNIITNITIPAPINGTVSNVTAQIGSPVDPSTPIAEIVNNAELHLDLFVYEKDLPRLKPNQVIHFTLTNNPGKEYDARIFAIGTAFANESKTIPVHAVVLGDKAGLIEGMNITALISVGQNVVPAVPNDAIVSYLGRDFVFVQTDAPAAEKHQHEEGESGGNEKRHEESPSRYFERVQVVKGATDVGYTEVTLLKDVAPKTPIVSKGAFFVQAKMTNTGGHDH